MSMVYTDPITVSDPTTGGVAPAAWGDVLRDNGEFFINPPACNVHNSVAVSVANTTPTILAANSERFDTAAMHSTVTNNSRITFPITGNWELTAAVGADGDIDGIRQIAFLFNGVTQSIRWRHGTGTSGAIVLAAQGRFRLSAGEYAEVQVEHSAGAALNHTLHEFCAKFDTR